MDYDVKTMDISTLYPDPEEEKYKKQGIATMNALLRTALNDKKISHMQFNFQDKDVLRDAQKHPEEYPTADGACGGLQRVFHRSAPRCAE